MQYFCIFIAIKLQSNTVPDSVQSNTVPDSVIKLQGNTVPLSFPERAYQQKIQPYFNSCNSDRLRYVRYEELFLTLLHGK